jgi:hypothetical protein
LSQAKGRSKNPGTNSSVPGRPGTKSFYKKKQKTGCFKTGKGHSKTGKDVLKQEKDVLKQKKMF